MKKFLYILFAAACLAFAPVNTNAQCDEPDCYLVLDGSSSMYSSWWGLYDYVDIYQNDVYLTTWDPSDTDTIRFCKADGDIKLSVDGYSGDLGYLGLTVYDAVGQVIFDQYPLSGFSVGQTLLEYTPCPDCQPYDIQVTDIDLTTATVSWSEVGDATSWYYTYGTSPVCDENWTSTSSNSISLSGLIASTTYYVWIKSDCEGNPGRSKVSFNTKCGDITELPTGTDFNSGFPICWTVIDSVEDNLTSSWTTYYFPKCTTNYYYNGYLYPVSGNGYIMTARAGRVTIRTSKINVGSDFDVIFYANGTANIEVGYTTSDDADAEVTVVKEVEVDNSAMTKFIVPFLDMPSDGAYVIFSVPQSLSSFGPMIDDVTIDYHVDCSVPTKLVKEDNLNNDEISLSWTDDEATKWQVVYGVTGFNQNASNVRSVQALTNSITISDLSADTVYDFYVRADCGGVYGYWCEDMVTARPGSYNLSGNDTIEACGVMLFDDGGEFANHGYNHDPYTLVVRPTSEDEAIKLSGWVNFYNYNESDNYATTLTVYEGEGTSGLVLAKFTNEGGTATASNNNVNIYSETGAVTLVFKVPAYSYYVNSGFALKADCYTKPDCRSPRNFTFEHSDGENAMFAWECSQDPSQFTIKVYDLTDVEVLSKTVEGTARRDTIFAGLTENTKYYAVISAACDGDNAAFTEKVSFKTPCVVGGDIHVGPEEAYTTSSYFIYGYGRTSITQHLIPADQLSELSGISGIRLPVASVPTNSTFNFKIYIDTVASDVTTLTSFVTPDSTVAPYFDSSYTFAVGNNEIYFDTPYIYGGVGGLVMTIWKVAEASESRYMYTYSGPYDYSNYMGQYYYSYYDSISPWDVSYSYGVASPLMFDIIQPCGDKSCAPVKITSTVVDSTSITLTWDKGNEETAWNVLYRNVDSTSWDTAALNLAVQTYTISGLLPGTDYTVRIETVCDADKVAKRSVKVTTECAHIPLPYFTDFENFKLPSSTTGAVQNCWYRTGYSYYPYNYNGSYYAYSGSKALYYYYYYPNSGPGYLVTPQVAGLNKTAVSFFARAYDYSYDYYFDGRIVVGVMEDPEDYTTFVPVDSVDLPLLQPYTEYHLLMKDYNGVGENIALKFAPASIPDDYSYTYGYCYIYLDDLTIGPAPSCLWIQGANVTGVTNNSITFAADDKYGRSKYNIYYNTTEDLSTATKVTFTGTTTTIAGLSPSTEYFYWIEAVCDDNTTSPVVFCGSVSTICDPIKVTKEQPFETELEDDTYLECFWVGSEAAGQNWFWTLSGYNYYSISYSGVGSFNMTSNASGISYLALPTFDFSALDTTAQLTFYFYPNNGGYSSNNAATASVLYRSEPNKPWVEIPLTDVTGSWNKHFVDLPGSKGAAEYQVAIKTVGGNSSYPASVDNLYVGAATECVPPNNFTIDDVTDRTATLSWDKNKYSDYRIQFHPTSSWSWNSRTAEDATEYTLAPLTMNTDYEVRIASVCGLGQYSEYSPAISFHTNFCDNNVSAQTFTASQTEASSKGQLFSCEYYKYKYYTYSEIMIPASKLDGINEISLLNIYPDDGYYGEYMNNVAIYMGHTTDADLSGSFKYDTTFVKVYQGPLNYSQACELSVPLTNYFTYDGTSNIVIGFYKGDNSYGYSYNDTTKDNSFKAHVGSDVYFRYAGMSSTFSVDEIGLMPSSAQKTSTTIPDVKIGACIPTCYEPIVAKTTTTSSTVTVEWYKEKDLQVNIQMKAADATTWDNPVTLAAGINSYTFTMLSPMTKYDIRLQRDCLGDGTFVSDWVELTATTDTACSIPEAVKATNVSAKTAELSWTTGSVANTWEIHVWNTGFDKYYTVKTNPAVVDGLTPGNSYKVQVRAYCGSNDHVVGEWSETATFQNTCEPVSGVTANVSGTNVTLSWVGASNNNKYFVAWGPKDFNANEQIGYAEVEGTSYTITGLKGQTYTFRVRGICGDGWNSVWTSANATVVGIDDVEEQNAQFYLQPNPATSRVTLSLEDFEGTANVSILSVDGRQISQFNTVESSTVIDLSEYAAGTYFVRVQTEGWTSVRKLIVK